MNVDRRLVDFYRHTLLKRLSLFVSHFFWHFVVNHGSKATASGVFVNTRFDKVYQVCKFFLVLLLLSWYQWSSWHLELLLLRHKLCSSTNLAWLTKKWLLLLLRLLKWSLSTTEETWLTLTRLHGISRSKTTKKSTADWLGWWLSK